MFAVGNINRHAAPRRYRTDQYHTSHHDRPPPSCPRALKELELKLRIELGKAAMASSIGSCIGRSIELCAVTNVGHDLDRGCHGGNMVGVQIEGAASVHISPTASRCPPHYRGPGGKQRQAHLCHARFRWSDKTAVP
ncbi:hypothetical protein NL676_010341 [Syzygium grande]|nr:hypothetical protein NL676_010341 [Syzygium grande]